MSPGDPVSALLVIHGIGEQRPYEALDSVVQGLGRRCGIKDGDLEHRLVWHGEHADTAVRLPLKGMVERGGGRWLDVYEYYWAAEVERSISLRKVLAWTARTSLTPLRSWARNFELLRQEERPPVVAFYREMGRAIFLLAFAATVIGLFIWVGLHQGDIRGLLAKAWQALVQPLPAVAVQDGQPVGLGQRLVRNAFPLVLFAWVVLVTLGLALLRSLNLLGSASAEQAAMQEKAFRPWRRRSLVFAGVFIGLAILAALTPSLGIGTAVWGAASILLGTRYTLGLVLAVALAAVGRNFLVKYLGDVALYVDEDERSESFQTRDKVLNGAVERLSALLRDAGYVSVHVAGHSLGSVVAYDAVNCLTRVMRAGPDGDRPPGCIRPEEFAKLGGLLTFGSPLDKVSYFFRTDVRAGQKVRSQLLSSLHSFRKRSSGRNYGAMHFAVYNPPEPRRLLWLNVHSPSDPVSGSLDFYRTDHQVSLGYAPTPGAHLKYWSDPRFYDWLALWLCAPDAERLRVGPQPNARPPGSMA